MSVSDKIWGAGSRWLMGRVMPPKFLDGVGEYLHLVAPDREGELTAAIKARAEDTADADREMVVDGALGGGAGDRCDRAASFETLLPMFDDKVEQRFADERV